MNKSAKTYLWVGLAFAIILGGLWQFFPLQSAQNRIEKLPLNGLDYRGMDIPLSPFEEQFFQGVHVLKRLYHVDGQNYFITVLDGTNNRHIVHDPYYCFKGGGWDVVSEKPFKLNNGTASLLRIMKDGRVKEALYWFTDGKEQYNSPIRYWWQATMRRLTLGASGSEPVLVMIQPVGPNTVNWEELLQALSGLKHI